MRILRKVPKRLPSKAVLIREAKHEYAIWSGRSWFGSVSRLGKFWSVSSPLSPSETFETLSGAMEEAESRALYAEGLK